jgi:hypothetical protein
MLLFAALVVRSRGKRTESLRLQFVVNSNGRISSLTHSTPATLSEIKDIDAAAQ